MNLYKQWEQTVVQFVQQKGERAFWNEYGQIEKGFYEKVLADVNEPIEGKVSELSERFDIPEVFLVGILDGINESVETPLDVENVEEGTDVSLKIMPEKLYFNMLDSKADYLYTLPQWNTILTEEQKKEITKEWRASKVVVKEEKIGRNDPCTCGSGKKYKKCCGK